MLPQAGYARMENDLLGKVIRGNGLVAKVVGIAPHTLSDETLPLVIQPMREVDDPTQFVDWWDWYKVVDL
jgi:hypothetical protein